MSTVDEKLTNLALEKEYKFLTKEQVQHFMQKGYLKLPHAFTKDRASEWISDLWVRLGMDPENKSTWTQERIHMPHFRRELVSDFCPQAWGAMCELLGGQERVSEGSAVWNDGFIVNLGRPEDEGKLTGPRDLPDWHADGDFFLHFLDSPEQALLVIPLFSDIRPSGGATFIAPEGVGHVARKLADHPEGLQPGLGDKPDQFDFLALMRQCDEFVEATGEVGDVYLLHPLILHCASRNSLRDVRVITNPPVSLNQPFNFNRANPSEFSIVELKTLQSLGVERLDFKPTTERQRIVPERVKRQQRMKEQEMERMKNAGQEVPKAKWTQPATGMEHAQVE
ncbi:hypothetical protein DACRYDRAFT_21927 [Dacryopinax primogenitus]|uniref:Phytanoyl-CoA dioxygenase n=1 Tax=Dacryopinax primogenitus (strain DJM 731) TaxID=1858805 RepID=M5G0D4_DACPD|nr:uncharacterized protein DACRYDRAFT_21927 [Dacryopinax primogenitus]EJU02189.1 hypothetical protein DACRYDRAFT_21927 [Dacryopinax primogenitus]